MILFNDLEIAEIRFILLSLIFSTFFIIIILILILFKLLKFLIKMFLLFSFVYFLILNFVQSLNCPIYPFYLKDGIYCALPACIEKHVVDYCPQSVLFDYMKLGGQECFMKNCSVSFFKDTTLLITKEKIYNEQLEDVQKPGLICYKSKLATEPFLHILKSKVGFCKSINESPEISNGSLVLQKPFMEASVCCGPICEKLKNNEAITGLISYCSKLNVAVQSSDGISHSYTLFNTSPKSCQKIDCFFCKDFLVRASCDDIFVSIIWFFLSSLFGILFFVMIYVKILIYKIIKRKINEKEFMKVNQEEDIIMEEIRPRRIPLHPSLLAIIFLTCLCTETLACSDTIVVHDSTKSSTTSSMEVGKVFCLTDNKDHIFKFWIEDIVLNFHQDYLYSTDAGEFKFSYKSTFGRQDWLSAGYDVYGNKVSTGIDITCCNPVAISRFCSNMHSKQMISFFDLLKPTVNVMMNIQDSNGVVSRVTLNGNSLYKNDLVEIEIKKYQKISTDWKLALGDKAQLINNLNISPKGNPRLDMIGSVQCEVTGDNYDCILNKKQYHLLCTDDCHDKLGVWSDAQDCYKLIRKENFSGLYFDFPLQDQYGVWHYVDKHVFYNVKNDFDILVQITKKGWSDIKVDSKNCKVINAKQSGLHTQKFGAILTVRTDAPESLVKIHYENNIDQFFTKDYIGNLIITTSSTINEIFWSCGENNGTISVEGILLQGVTLEKMAHVSNALTENKKVDIYKMLKDFILSSPTNISAFIGTIVLLFLLIFRR